MSLSGVIGNSRTLIPTACVDRVRHRRCDAGCCHYTNAVRADGLTCSSN